VDESAGESGADVDTIGLCAACLYVRAQNTKRGAVFYRCARADEDEAFMRYPPIPVARCVGFEERRSGSEQNSAPEVEPQSE
jgi:hypothetical protein